MADRFRIRLVSVLLALYLAIVAAITLPPSPVDRPVRGQIDRVLEELHERGVPEYIGYSKVEFAANIAMFVPVGFLIALGLAARFAWLALLLGPVLSAALELAQKLLLPERYASVLDVLANSLGALVGFVIAVLLRLLVARRDRLLITDVRDGRRRL
ncbi:MAG: hypothetical protein JWP66_819 [Naasia sp.]|nr:hypothetical protein [Naasia sp.]